MHPDSITPLSEVYENICDDDVALFNQIRRPKGEDIVEDVVEDVVALVSDVVEDVVPDFVSVVRPGFRLGFITHTSQTRNSTRRRLADLRIVRSHA